MSMLLSELSPGFALQEKISSEEEALATTIHFFGMGNNRRK
jgi:hypothetical protein